MDGVRVGFVLPMTSRNMAEYAPSFSSASVPTTYTIWRPGVKEVVSIVPVTLSTLASKAPSVADMAMDVAPTSQGAVSMYMLADKML